MCGSTGHIAFVCTVVLLLHMWSCVRDVHCALACMRRSVIEMIDCKCSCVRSAGVCLFVLLCVRGVLLACFGSVFVVVPRVRMVCMTAVSILHLYAVLLVLHMWSCV